MQDFLKTMSVDVSVIKTCDLVYRCTNKSSNMYM